MQRRALLAVIRDVLWRAVLRRPIDAPVLMHRRGVRVDLAVPGLLRTEIRRGIDDRVGERRARRPLADRRLYRRLYVMHRVEDRLRVARQLGVAIDRAV